MLRRPTSWLLVGVLWTVPALIGALFMYVRPLQDVSRPSLARALTFSLPPWILWALLTPLVIGLKRRFPLDGRSLRTTLPVHLTAAACLTAIHLLLTTILLRALSYGGLSRSLWESYQYVLVGYFEFDFLIYWTVLGGAYLVDFYERSRQGDLRAARLEVRLAQAQLEALRVQLQPHFLFNTLHAISSLMEDNVEQARRMLVRLGDLLRLTLETGGVQEVTLRQELECVELYLDIERVRFSDKLEVEMIADRDALDALVPNLILQPLVENAVKYGIAPLSTQGKIEIRASREGEALRIVVKNTGRNGEDYPPGRGGVGMTNVRDRLSRLYGAGQDFKSYTTEDGGFGVELVVPYRSNDVR
ncbi:MAG: histidine kinase [Acidobacteria bacterium]|nr:histidine kinase [Acidobacteriota bacterium]